jgi:hypothetical protein
MTHHEALHALTQPPSSWLPYRQWPSQATTYVLDVTKATLTVTGVAFTAKFDLSAIIAASSPIPPLYFFDTFLQGDEVGKLVSVLKKITKEAAKYISYNPNLAPCYGPTYADYSPKIQSVIDYVNFLIKKLQH